MEETNVTYLRIAVTQICILFIFNFSAAQTNIYGSVTDTSGKLLGGANVLLLRVADSSLVRGVLTSRTGSYMIPRVGPGKYFITCTHVGFVRVNGKSFDIAAGIDKAEQSPFILHTEKQQLTGVTVTAWKPLFEQKSDRLVVNVSNSITAAGNTVIEVLERSPGVIVDRQNNLISMNGKEGVVLMLNGKISRMPVGSIVQLLSGMNAGNIERIELITIPPANFDAEGNAGYINIVLKENNNYGTNGSVSVTSGYGKGFITQQNVNLNYRKGRINLYGDLSYSHINSPLYIDSYRRFSNQSVISERRIVVNRATAVGNINGRAGLDIQLTSHTILGFLLSAYNNRYSQHEMNHSILNKNGQPDTITRLFNDELNHWYNCSANANLQHTYSNGNRLSFNIDYIWYHNTQPVNYNMNYYDGSARFLYNQQNKSFKNTPLHFTVAAIDANRSMTKHISIEAGLKATLSAFDNEISFGQVTGNGFKKDSGLSATYQLKENYAGVYASFNVLPNKKTTIKLGLRYEYTSSNLGTEFVENIVDRRYGSFFPSLFFSYKITGSKSVNFSYSRRITRPTFNDLAPFNYFSDANTLVTGNPALQPSFSNIVKLDYIFKKYLAAVSFSREDNAIAGFQPKIDSVSGKMVTSATNLINQETIAAIISVPVMVKKWWTMQYNFTGAWQQVSALSLGKPVGLSHTRFQVNGSMNFSLAKDFSIELAGSYQSRGVRGVVTTRSTGSLDIGIKKRLPAKKGAFVFAVTNVLNTVRGGNYLDLPEENIYFRNEFRFTQRTYKLTYTKSFGKDKLRQKRERSTGAEDEKGRVQ